MLFQSGSCHRDFHVPSGSFQCRSTGLRHREQSNLVINWVEEYNATCMDPCYGVEAHVVVAAEPLIPKKASRTGICITTRNDGRCHRLTGKSIPIILALKVTLFRFVVRRRHCAYGSARWLRQYVFSLSNAQGRRPLRKETRHCS